MDTDGDGIGNNADLDDDNDGVPDVEDAFSLDATESIDTDGDGIGNNADFDDDNDGVADVEDGFPLDPTETLDTDGDGIGNNADLDDDGDSLPDDWEVAAGLNPLDAADAAEDLDGDGISNLDEFLANTDPSDTDTDDDGVQNSSDRCADTNENEESDNYGCGTSQNLCSTFNDIDGHRFAPEMCYIIDNHFWKIDDMGDSFNPDATVSFEEEIYILLSVLGVREDAEFFEGIICPEFPLLSYAIETFIVDENQCDIGLTRRMREILKDAELAKKQRSDSDRIDFDELNDGYQGPDYGNLQNPYGIESNTFNVAYELNALIDFENMFNPSDVSYGFQFMTRATLSKTLFHYLELNHEPEGHFIPRQKAYEGEMFELDISTHFTDEEDDELTFSAQYLPEGLQIDELTGIISGIPTADSIKERDYLVIVTANDGFESSGMYFYLKVYSDDIPELVFSIVDQTVFAGEDYRFSFADNFIHPQGWRLDYTIDGLPEGLAVSDAGGIKGVVSKESIASFPYEITITAYNGLHSISTQFMMTVVKEGAIVPELIESLPDMKIALGKYISVNVATYFSHPKNAPLTYDAEGLPEGVIISDGGYIKGSVPRDINPSLFPLEIIVTASDGIMSVSDIFEISVIE